MMNDVYIYLYKFISSSTHTYQQSVDGLLFIFLLP